MSRASSTSAPAPQIACNSNEGVVTEEAVTLAHNAGFHCQPGAPIVVNGSINAFIAIHLISQLSRHSCVSQIEQIQKLLGGFRGSLIPGGAQLPDSGVKTVRNEDSESDLRPTPEQQQNNQTSAYPLHRPIQVCLPYRLRASTAPQGATTSRSENRGPELLAYLTGKKQGKDTNQTGSNEQGIQEASAEPRNFDINAYSPTSPKSNSESSLHDADSSTAIAAQSQQAQTLDPDSISYSRASWAGMAEQDNLELFVSESPSAAPAEEDSVSDYLSRDSDGSGGSKNSIQLTGHNGADDYYFTPPLWQRAMIRRRPELWVYTPNMQY
ncbi:hypothetical protein QBC44DRAFT_310191 [Cladorrhinum sp. PSN332]|nr:hypothetical protein QBC44DRAFT_310191 [Cladorrhinum sp. PSN332]